MSEKKNNPAPLHHVQAIDWQARCHETEAQLERSEEEGNRMSNALGVAERRIAEMEAATSQDGLGVDIPRLPIGTAVEKVGGYPFPGEVRCSFTTRAGQERFVVEATGEQYAGMLHIFNGGQLRAALKSEGSNNG